MEFFEILKRRICIKKLLYASLGFFVAVTSFMFGMVAIERKSLFLAAILFILSPVILVLSLLWAFNNHEYNKLLKQAKNISGLNYLGNMLESIQDHKYARGQLRFNETIIFYFKDLNAQIISPKNIKQIKTSRIYDNYHSHNRYYVNIICKQTHLKGNFGNTLAQVCIFALISGILGLSLSNLCCLMIDKSLSLALCCAICTFAYLLLATIFDTAEINLLWQTMLCNISRRKK